MLRRVGAHWPLYANILILCVAVTALVVAGKRRTGGEYVCPLDDAYIHMSMARTLVQDHAWGVTPARFGSSSSSLLWEPLLAGSFRLFGLHAITPLVLATVFGCGVLVVAYTAFRRHGLSTIATLVALLLLQMAVPLPVLAFSAMEHVLQLLIDLGFILVVAGLLASDKPRQPARYLALLALAMLTTTVRFEGLFLVFVACLVMLWQRRWIGAVVVGLAAIAPVVLYGWFSVRHGGLYLPNSVLLKGHPMDLHSLQGIVHSLGFQAAVRLTSLSYLAPLVAIGAAALVAGSLAGEKRESLSAYVLILALGTTLLHLQFASYGCVYRYDAYLIGLLLTGITLAAAPYLHRPAWPPTNADLRLVAGLAVFAFVAAMPLLFRMRSAVRDYTIAPYNVYCQQIQMGRFLQTYYAGKTIAANDIGAITWLGKINLVDTYGLDNINLAKKKLAGTYGIDDVMNEARVNNASIAIVYDAWLPAPPTAWTPVAKWTIPDNIVCSQDNVTFYAIDPAEKERLPRLLEEYRPRLPVGVKVERFNAAPTTRPGS